jgi:2-polyprenyl-3-methyl-5-hydroxy-6-metoxy-1,4-benzoquinol methylase
MRREKSTFAPNHDGVLSELSDAHNYNAWLFERGAPFLGQRVLDVGAGIGTFTTLAAGRARSVTALEPDPVFAARLRERFESVPGVDVVQADVTDLDLSGRAGTFDSIICFNVLEHVADDELALRRFHDLLAPGGSLLLLVPAHRWLVSPFDRAVGHERRYESAGLRTLVARAGFILRDVRYVNPVGAIGWLVSMRLRRRRDLPGAQVRAFDRLVPLLRPLDRLRLPFGQSIWVVAEKSG